MKNLLTLLLAIFLIGFVSPLFGQVSVGVRGGVSFGSLSLQDQVLDNKTIATPSISLPVEIRLSKLAAIQPEVNYYRQSGTLTRSLSSLSSAGSSAASEQVLPVQCRLCTGACPDEDLSFQKETLCRHILGTFNRNRLERN